MPKKAFTDSEDEKLVECVSNDRVLYDHEDTDFRNRHVTSKMWEKVADAVGKDAEMCKKRWKDIRDNFFKILRKNKSSTGSAAPASVNKWALFDRLAFLNSVRRERETFCNISPQECTNVGDTSDNDGDSSSFGATSDGIEDATHESSSQNTLTPASDKSSLRSTHIGRSASSKRSRMQGIEEMSKRRLALLEHIATQKKEDDDVDCFMKSIALSVKKLPRHLISQAKIDILSTVTRLEAQASYETSEVPSATMSTLPYLTSAPSSSATYVTAHLPQNANTCNDNTTTVFANVLQDSF